MTDEDKPTEVIEPTVEATEGETTPTEPTVEPPTEGTEPPVIPPENVEETLKEKGFNYEELQEEYIKNGDLTKETRDKLAEIGINEDFINDFIAGKKAIYEKQVAEEQAELIKSVGGKETFDNVIKWAAENLTKEDIESLNNVKNMAAQKWILQGFKSSMEAKEGIIPQFVQGGGTPQVEIFESKAQMIEAIKDKRYTTDLAYQDKVTKKIQASRKAGINLGI